MKNFKDLGIKPPVKNMEGDKIQMDRILNREIKVLDYRIENSKFGEDKGKCLYMQIGIGDNKHLVFTGSIRLMEAIKQVPTSEFPFLTTIVKENKRFEFT